MSILLPSAYEYYINRNIINNKLPKDSAAAQRGPQSPIWFPAKYH